MFARDIPAVFWYKTACFSHSIQFNTWQQRRNSFWNFDTLKVHLNFALLSCLIIEFTERFFFLQVFIADYLFNILDVLIVSWKNCWKFIASGCEIWTKHLSCETSTLTNRLQNIIYYIYNLNVFMPSSL